MIKDIINYLSLKYSLTDANPSTVCKFEQTENQLSFVHDDVRGCVSLTGDNNLFAVSLKMHNTHESSYIHSRFEEIKFSITVDKEESFLALYNYNGWWTKPLFAKEYKDIPKNTQLLSWQKNGMCYVLLTLCDDNFKSIIMPAEEAVEVELMSNTCGYSNLQTKAFVVCSDTDPYTAYERAMHYALEILDTTNRPTATRRYPDMFNYLGFCTWNAFYSDVNKDGVIEKADEFLQKKLPVKWMLIDHGWSRQENEMLCGFDEDKEKFPGGLKLLKRELQKRGVDRLGVWQGFGGHWGTIKRDSDVYNQMHENLLTTNSGHIIPYPTKEKCFAFWNTWHRYLRQQGVDFIKVDIQSSLSVFTKGQFSIGKAARESHLGLEASAGVNFDGALINCMGMAMEQVLNRPVSAVCRNSNDFFPKKENSFKAHVYENAYNSLYHSHVSIGDFDMWWTKHPDAQNNAYLRAVSGGPLYISDQLGETDAEKIWPLILNDGYVLRCEKQGIITKDQVYRDPSKEKRAVKLWNIKGETGYVGVFNCCEHGVTATAEFKASDVAKIAETDRYLVYLQTQGDFIILNKDDTLELSIASNCSELASITPIIQGFAFIGNINKYISSAVIENAIKGDNSMLYVLKEGGDVAFYSEKAVAKVMINGKNTTFDCNNNIYKVDCSYTKEKMIIEILF